MKNELFKNFSKDTADLPFCLQYDWWNEVVQENWEVAVVENQGEVKAIWPYTIAKTAGFTQLRSADFTPYVGPFVIYPPGQKNHRKYSYERKILEDLLEQLPAFHSFEQNSHLELHNVLPLIWKGWKQSVRYTYIIDDLSDLESVYSGFADNIRREIKKAEKEVLVEESKEIAPVLTMMQSSYAAQGLIMNIKKSIFENIENYFIQHSCGKIFFAKNQQGNTIAAIAMVWDHKSAYYLMGGADMVFKNSGAMSLLMWKAIQFSSTKVNSFNFEGSMIPNVERFFRGFGGDLTPFHHLSCSKSNLLRLLKSLKK